MQYNWRCQKCLRYLSTIDLKDDLSDNEQRTICPVCKSENKIIININAVICSCGFSKKHISNLQKVEKIEAPNISKIF